MPDQAAGTDSTIGFTVVTRDSIVSRSNGAGSSTMNVLKPIRRYGGHRLGDLLRRPRPEGVIVGDRCQRRPVVLQQRAANALRLGLGRSDRHLAADRAFDLVGVPSDIVAVPAQHLVLVHELLR